METSQKGNTKTVNKPNGASNIPTLEESLQSLNLQSGGPKSVPKGKNGGGGGRNKKILRDSKSLKMYMQYRCTSCSKEWWSSHGWTDYTQRCARCGNTGEVIQHSRTPPVTDGSSPRGGRNILITGGGHNFQLCDMCQDINQSCIRLKGVAVKEIQNGHLVYKNVTLIRNETNFETYYHRFGVPDYPPQFPTGYIYNYKSF